MLNLFVLEQVSCSLCSETMEREILAIHKGENCPQRIVTCEFCEFPLPAVDLAEHQVRTIGYIQDTTTFQLIYVHQLIFVSPLYSRRYVETVLNFVICVINT